MRNTSAASADLANWICNSFALAILLVRLACIRYQHGRFNVSAYLVVLSLIVLAGRMAFEYYIIRYGTVSDLIGSDGHVSAEDLARAQTGSILSLVARVFITTFYWLMCMLLLLVYRTVLDSVEWTRIVIRICWAVIAITYVAVILTTFLECQPFHLYWQLHPNPGSCVRAYGQLILQGVSNIIIDLFLVAISVPILKQQIRAFPRNLQLGGMFIIGTFCVIVTCVRLKYTVAAHSSQNTRTLWASVQAFFAAFVANAASIWGAMITARRRQSASRSRSWTSSTLVSPTVQSSTKAWSAYDTEYQSTTDQPGARSLDAVNVEWNDAAKEPIGYTRDAG